MSFKIKTMESKAAVTVVTVTTGCSVNLAMKYGRGRSNVGVKVREIKLLKKGNKNKNQFNRSIFGFFSGVLDIFL